MRDQLAGLKPAIATAIQIALGRIHTFYFNHKNISVVLLNSNNIEQPSLTSAVARLASSYLA